MMFSSVSQYQAMPSMPMGEMTIKTLQPVAEQSAIFLLLLLLLLQREAVIQGQRGNIVKWMCSAEALTPFPSTSSIQALTPHSMCFH